MEKYYRVTFSDELYHHGIKGQKWGIRRYQNEDGSLTEDGKKRYAYENAKEKHSNLIMEYRDRAKYTSRSNQKSLNELRKFRDKVHNADYDKAKAKSEMKNNEKAKMRVLAREMGKSGIPGSIKDDQTERRSSIFYDRLKKEKGKEYADRVVRKVKRTKIAQLSAVGAAYVAVLAAEYYSLNHY